MFQGFKEFISRGNAIDLAVGVIIGGAFTPIVNAITNLLMGIIGAIFGAPNFDSLGQFTINNSDPIQPGAILTALVNFLLIAIALYFFVVVPMNKLAGVRASQEPEDTPEDVRVLTEIRDLLQAQTGTGSDA